MQFRLVAHRGKWAAAVTAGGERRRFSTGYDATAENREAAERAAREALDRLTKTSATTVGKILDAYLDDCVERQVIDVERLRIAASHLRPHFGGLEPHHVDRPTCRAYTAHRRSLGRGDGTILKELRTLSAALLWHDKNTPAVVEAPRQPEPRDRWLTRREFARLLQAAQGTPHLEVFLHLAIATAARKEAILGLTWDMVDMQAGEVRLGTKEGGKRRAIKLPMTKRLRAVLQTHYHARTCDYVVSYGGKQVRDIKTAWRHARDAAGLRGVTIHDIRHTAAVWMVGAGVDMHKVSQYLGHSSINVTARIYARFAPEHLTDAAAALEVG